MAEKIISIERLQRNDLQSVQGALTKSIANARMASNGKFDGSSAILVDDEDGWNITGVALVEQSLSDGSKVYTARLLFGEASEKLQIQIDALTKQAKSSALPKVSTQKEIL